MADKDELENDDEIIVETETEETNLETEEEEHEEHEEHEEETLETSEDDTDDKDINKDVDDDSVVITIDGEEEPEEDSTPAPAWVSELRKNHREAKKRIKELETQLDATTSSKLPTLGPKPRLEDCDYDEEKYESELSGWYERKARLDDEEKRIENEQKAQQDAWNQKVQNYESAKNTLKIKGFDEAEDLVKSLFSTTQQGAIIQGAKDPAALIWAIGSNPGRAQALATITDPVEFIFAVADLQARMKVTSKKSVPATKPETRVKGTAKSTSAVDSTLENLRKEAERTGDYSKVNSYKRRKRQQV
jgi:hypothetical protein